MDGPKNPANAALSAARRQDPITKGHDEARKAVKDLLDRRGNGEPPATLRKRKGVYGCDIMRDKAPDHKHRLKDEAYCRELMALTTYKLRDDTVHLARLQLCRGAAGARGDPLPQAHGGEAMQVHLVRLQLCRIEAAGRESAQC